MRPSPSSQPPLPQTGLSALTRLEHDQAYLFGEARPELTRERLGREPRLFAVLVRPKADVMRRRLADGVLSADERALVTR